MKAHSLAVLLNHPDIEIVANHNLAASNDLKRLGINPYKIVPFDWPALTGADSHEPKAAPASVRTFQLIYVGSIVESKGVGDIIRAVAVLRARNRDVALTVIGRGDALAFKALAIAEGVESRVSFAGPKGHKEVLDAMREHDAVVVPSHWAYPEGLPMTLYEAFCVRTPLLTSDHPMFALRIRDEHNALVFAERNPAMLADCVTRLMETPGLYSRLSVASARAAQSFLCPLKYDHLISGFVSDQGRSGLKSYSLGNYTYA
jgi:glycosyltransferase involved in cell wall biosynthesis